MPEEIKLIQPVPVVRDECGMFPHPDLPDFDESDGEKCQPCPRTRVHHVSGLYIQAKRSPHRAGMDVSFQLLKRPIGINQCTGLAMKKWIFSLEIVTCLLTGCSHFSNSTYGSPTSPHKIACDDTPPNQPGCYNREHQEGVLNKLVDAIRERR